MTTVTEGDSSVIPELSQGPKIKEPRLSWVNCWSFISYLRISVTYGNPSHDQHRHSPVAATKQHQELVGIYQQGNNRRVMCKDLVCSTETLETTYMPNNTEKDR